MKDNTELLTINRGVLTLVRKQPFHAWSQALSPGLEMDEGEKKMHHAYLVRDDIGPGSLERMVERWFPRFFENELYEEWEDEKKWPQDRTWEMFNDWFDWYYAPMSWDMENGEIEKD